MIRKFILSQAAANLEVAVEASNENLKNWKLYGKSIEYTPRFKANELREKLHYFFATFLLALIGEDIRN